jgi:STE24 endopeptidase
MTMSEGRQSGGARRRVVRFALWRVVAAAPAVLGSLLLMLASVALSRWAGLLLLSWACAGALMTRVGERIAVRAACGFHQPSPGQAAAVQPAWATALRVTGTKAGDVELYVQTAQAPNAYAAGRRSVAVTTRVLVDYRAGRLPENQLVAALVHELGHHATGATRPTLLLLWLTAPWRVTASLLTGLAGRLAGRQPRPGLAVVVVAGLAVAVTRALQQGQWKTGGVLLVVGLAAVLGPLANAAISRQSEYAADRFAADHGFAIELAAALGGLDGGGRVAAGWPQRLLATHPPLDRRITALSTAADKSGRRTAGVEGRAAGSLATAGALASAHRDYESRAAGVTIKSSAVCQ